MKTRLIVVGRTADKHLSALISDYAGRISHYMPFQIIELKEDKNSRADKEKEADAMLKEIQTSDIVVLLDERGHHYRSIDFASWLNKKQQAGRNLTLIIGGPFGFSERIYQRADETVALSDMTFSHDMARLLLTEQLYRACTILKGEAYHHE